MKPIRTIVAATDLAESSRAVLEAARDLGERLEARVHVVHVVHDLGKYMGFYVGTPSIHGLQESLEREARMKLDTEVRAVFTGDHPPELHILKGTPFADLVARIETTGADLVIVGAQGPAKPEHDIFGSITERLVQRPPCPVLVVGA